jgi:hypothetical protein
MIFIQVNAQRITACAVLPEAVHIQQKCAQGSGCELGWHHLTLPLTVWFTWWFVSCFV